MQIVNPLSKYSAPDPCIVWDNQTNFYYLLFTNDNKVVIRRSKKLASICDGESLEVYNINPEDRLFGNFWAPEMHKSDNGKWYIYTSGSIKPNEPWGQKRLFVLESKSEDPFDGFSFKKILDDDLFAIDPTILNHDGKWSICYSEVSKEKGQVLVLRELINPWTFGEKRAELAWAELEWERVNLKVNEGPFFIRSLDKKRLFLIYSGNGCWSDDYSLGVIEFMGGDIFDAKQWKKSDTPLLYKGNNVFGPGHATFFNSPDGAEIWCAYHALKNSNPTCKPIARYLHLQRVDFDSEGYPIMGKTIGATPQPPPSGE